MVAIPAIPLALCMPVTQNLPRSSAGSSNKLKLPDSTISISQLVLCFCMSSNLLDDLSVDCFNGLRCK
jgi:hypothetical protein